MVTDHNKPCWLQGSGLRLVFALRAVMPEILQLTHLCCSVVCGQISKTSWGWLTVISKCLTATGPLSCHLCSFPALFALYLGPVISRLWRLRILLKTPGQHLGWNMSIMSMSKPAVSPEHGSIVGLFQWNCFAQLFSKGSALFILYMAFIRTLNAKGGNKVCLAPNNKLRTDATFSE